MSAATPTEAQHARRRPASAARRVACEYAALALTSGALYGWLSARGDFIGILSDGAVYVLMADLFSPWRDAPHALGAALFRDFPFPPLYPAVLGVLGGGSDAPAASYAASSMTLVAMVLAVHLWFTTRLASRAIALAATLSFALLPGTLLTAMNLQSEPLYLGLVMGGLALLARGAPAAHRAPLRAALLLGASVLARSVGLAAVGAALASSALGRARRLGRWGIAALLLPGLGWTVYRAGLAPRAGYLRSLAVGDPASVLANLAHTVAANAAHLDVALLQTFDLRAGAHVGAVLLAASVLGVCGWLRRLRSGTPDALYVLLYLAIVVAWPHPPHLPRFVYVLVPLWLGYVLEATAWLVARAGYGARQAQAQACVLVVLALGAAPSSLSMLGQVRAAAGSELAPMVRSPQWYSYANPGSAVTALGHIAAILESMRGIDEHVPRGACVSTTAVPFAVLYGRRRAEALPPDWRPRSELLAQLERCPYVFMIAATQWPLTGYGPMYPHAHIAPALEVIEVKLWEEGADAGQVLTMLARYRPAPDGERAE